jgi:hypothetical protein
MSCQPLLAGAYEITSLVGPSIAAQSWLRGLQAIDWIDQRCRQYHVLWVDDIELAEALDDRIAYCPGKRVLLE